MRPFRGAVAVAALMAAACGDDDGGGDDGGGAAGGGGDDSFCDGAAQLAELDEQTIPMLDRVVENMILLEGAQDDPTAAQQLEELLRNDVTAIRSELTEHADAVDEGYERMITGAADDALRTALEVHRELDVATLEAFAGIESAEDWGAAVDEFGVLSDDLREEHPDARSMAPSITDATQERCDVAFPSEPFGMRIVEVLRTDDD